MEYSKILETLSYTLWKTDLLELNLWGTEISPAVLKHKPRDHRGTSQMRKTTMDVLSLDKYVTFRNQATQ